MYNTEDSEDCDNLARVLRHLGDFLEKFMVWGKICFLHYYMDCSDIHYNT